MILIQVVILLINILILFLLVTKFKENSKTIYINECPEDIKGKRNYDSFIFFSKRIDGEIKPFVRYEYKGCVVLERQMDYYEFSNPEGREFKFTVAGLTGYF